MKNGPSPLQYENGQSCEHKKFMNKFSKYSVFCQLRAEYEGKLQSWQNRSWFLMYLEEEQRAYAVDDCNARKQKKS